MVLNSIYTFFKSKSTLKNIVVGVVFILFFNFMLIPIISILLNDNGNFISNILDVNFSYTEDIVNTALSNMGENGRSFYIKFALLIDIPYAIGYGFIYSIIIIKLFEEFNNIFTDYIFVFPFIISIFDIFENIGIVIALIDYPTINSFLINLTSILTSIKWSFAVIVGIIIAIGVIVRFKTFLTNRYSRV